MFRIRAFPERKYNHQKNEEHWFFFKDKTFKKGSLQFYSKSIHRADPIASRMGSKCELDSTIRYLLTFRSGSGSECADPSESGFETNSYQRDLFQTFLFQNFSGPDVSIPDLSELSDFFVARFSLPDFSVPDFHLTWCSTLKCAMSSSWLRYSLKQM
jgi:hypothetical protein